MTINHNRRLFLRVLGLTALSGLGGCGGEFTNPSSLPVIDSLFLKAIEAGQTPGAVVSLGHNQAIFYQQAYGARAVVPRYEREALDTIFDMASLTKPCITACALMQLWEQDNFSLDTPIAFFLPDFARNGKQSITLRHAATHYSGLPPDLDLSTPWLGKDAAVRRVMDSMPTMPVGAQFSYSDINFIAIGLVVERLSGLSLDRYAARYICAPLGLHDSGFLPARSLLPRIAPTQWDEQHVMLRGVVHDTTARRMGGVAGHAGFFSTARDTSILAQAILDRRAGRYSLYPLKRETLIMMTTPQQPAGQIALRGIGWDINTHYSSARGDRFPIGSFGHTGFTGTSIWLDPQSDSAVVILSNRVHPDGGGDMIKLRHDVATEAAALFGVS